MCISNNVQSGAARLKSAADPSLDYRKGYLLSKKKLISRLKTNSNYIWAAERAKNMRERGLIGKWLGPLCLPMLFVIQPLTTINYNLRAVCCLLFLGFILWTQYNYRFLRKFSGEEKRGGGFFGFERQCEKCDGLLGAQIRDNRKQSSTSAFIGCCWWELRSLRRLPWRLLSRHWGKISNCDSIPQWMTVILIWFYVKLFSCKLDEAEICDLRKYPSLGAFFTRRLKPGVRPISEESDVVSPADGLVTVDLLEFKGGYLQQVKGVHYSLNYFLGGLEEQNQPNLHAAVDDVRLLLRNKDGSTGLFQWVVYLSPGDYHRFHSPADWTINRRRHFPGELLSVKPRFVGALPGLFHLNERVSWTGRWKHGFFSLTAVGATNVGSINAAFDPDLRTNQAVSRRSECTIKPICGHNGRRNFYFTEKTFDDIPMSRGQEFGHFNFGSTIVLLFEAPKAYAFAPAASEERRISVGQSIFLP